MKIDGACHCGTIRFEAEIEPDRVVLCHCTDCQVMSGTAFRTVVATTPGSFRLMAGRPTIYVKRGDSGRDREQAFCGRCGTPIYSAPRAPEPRVLGLRAGAIRQRAALPPRAQIWCRSALPWVETMGALPRCATQPEFEADGRFGSAPE